MTDLENEVLELALQWVDAKYAVEEALIRQEFIRKIKMMKKERRDNKSEVLKRSKTWQQEQR